MSRSYKKNAILKDGGGSKAWYWRVVRHHQNQEVREGKDISNPKSIVNDYDYCDYRFDHRFNDSCWCQKTFGRKRCIQK